MDADVTSIETAIARGDELVEANHEDFTQFFSKTIGDRAMALEESKRELKDKQTVLAKEEDALKKATEKTAPLRAEQSKAEAELRQFEEDNQKQASTLVSKVDNMRSASTRIDSLKREVERMTAEVAACNADRDRVAIEENERQIEETRDRIQDIAVRIANADSQEKQLRIMEDTLYNLNANRQIEVLRREISELQADIGQPSPALQHEVSF